MNWQLKKKEKRINNERMEQFSDKFNVISVEEILMEQ